MIISLFVYILKKREEMSLTINLPDNCDTKPKITVIGVGGAGGNAVNNMIPNLEGVEFCVANTDAQALENSLTNNRIQLGAKSTKGLGAGSHPEVGKLSAEESMSEIVGLLDNSNMVFITAGMGGGTGTGAAPVIAKAAKEKGVLTVAVVTKPFHFEGARRMKIAELGIEELSKYVDTLIVIPNQNLFRIANEKTTFAQAFEMADEVLYAGVRGITDLIIMPGLINLDFADIRTVMGEMGKAMMGTGEAEGENRAILAAEAAISNPLLDNTSMKGARGVLINITGGSDMTLFQVDAAANRIREEVDPEANIIVGSAFNQDLTNKMRVSVVATGIDVRPMHNQGSFQNQQGMVAKKTHTEDVSPAMSFATQVQQNTQDVVVDGAFIPQAAIEPTLYEETLRINDDEDSSSTSNSDNANFAIPGNSPFNHFEKEEMEVKIMQTPPANDVADIKVDTANQQKAKSKEDFFDIPAFIRKKMKF